MRRVFLLLSAVLLSTIGWSQTLHIQFKNGQSVQFDAENIEYVEFAEKTDNNTSVTSGDAIDLGLSVKWASCNVGATSPEEYGDRHGWGEVNHRSGTFTKKTYLYYDNYNECFINIGKDIGGTDYDAAHVKWGGNWRMPTYDELKELKDKCKWEWTKINGVNGFLVTANNGNSIFFPSGSSPTTMWASEEYNSSFAYAIVFGSGMQYANNSYDKWVGGYVRPVMP